MILNIGLLVIGFFFLIKGADYFVEGAAKLALKYKIPEIVVGLTIVAFGTSAPEAAVSITSALKNSADLAVGNVIGSNILNVLLILGLCGLFAKLTVNNNTFKYEIPFVVVISGLLIFLGFDGKLTFIDGVVLLVFFGIFLTYLWNLTKQGQDVPIDEVEELDENDTLAKLIFLIAIGLVLIVFGSDLAVRGATDIALALGVSQRVIGLTIVALGTSLPELITSLTAVIKGKNDLGVGNIVGSNIFNILFVLGVTGLISPSSIPFQANFIVDGFVSILAMVVFYLAIFKNRYLERVGSTIMLLVFGGYLVYLLK